MKGKINDEHILITFEKKQYMKFPSPVTLKWIADFIGATIVGNTEGAATGINEIHKVEEGDLVFVDHPKYYIKCINSAASYIIINKEMDVPAEKALLVVENPFVAYSKIVNHFRPFEPSKKMISDSAVIGEGCTVYPNVFIGNHVTIGKNCILYPNVTIMDYSVIGDRVIIHPGSVVGSKAFYYNTKKNREVWYEKMPDCGRVVIEDDVEIGANCTIDRGVSHDTVIGKGTKMDNLLHVGHDTVIGKNGLFAAQSGIAGAVNIGNGVVVWGQCGISKTLSIGDNTTLLAMSGVGGNLAANKIYWGAPAEEAGIKKRELVWIKRIPEIWKKLMEKES